VAVSFISALLMGVDACFYPIPRIAPIPIIDDPDSRCGMLMSTDPPDLDFDPATGLAWVVDPAPSQLVPFTVETPPPVLAAAGPLAVPLSSTLRRLALLGPIGIEGVSVRDSLALLTSTGVELRDDLLRLVDLDPSSKSIVSLQVSVPAELLEPTYPDLPAPDEPAEARDEVSTTVCLDPDGLDSRGDEIGGGADCAGFFANSTSGAAVVGAGAERSLFVSMANPGGDLLSSNPRYLPGAVLVYDIDLASGIGVAPNATTPVIYTSGFNPTQVTPYHAGDRDFLLVTVSGAIGVVQDDLGTIIVEGGYSALTDAAIDVIDAETLALVATIPLGKAGLVGNLVLHPGGRLAVVGSMIDRWLLAVDLAPLADPLFPSEAPAEGPVVLDGSAESGLANAVIRDASRPYEIPARGEGGADPAVCPGLVAGLAFNHAGNLLYATDFCDGTLGMIGVADGASMTAPSLMETPRVDALTAPGDTPEAIDAPPNGLGGVAVRPGDPGVDYSGPDVFVIVGKPNGLLCAVAVESGD